MRQPFIILALPRSRTAWLAHYLSAGGQHRVGHDAVIECDDVQSFVGLFGGRTPLAGSCETAAVLGWRLIRELLPAARVVVVRRPIGEVIASLRRMGLDPNQPELELRNDMLASCAAAPGVESLMFGDLADRDCRKWLFEYLLDEPLDDGWDATVTGLNIQINMLERSLRLAQRRDAIAGFKAEVVAATMKLGAPSWMV